MIAQDIVDALSGTIPLYTSAFSNSANIISATIVGTTVSVQTDVPHGLIDGQNVAIQGVDAPVQIDVGTFLRTGTTATFETLQDHDLTLSPRDVGKTVTLSGANEPEFVGTFALVKVHNRRKLSIAVVDAGPTTMTGPALVDDANGSVFTGFATVSNVGLDTFDYEVGTVYPIDPVLTSAVVQTSIRILSVLDINQYLADAYTAQLVGDAQLVVQLGDVVQSKSRDESTDAATSVTGNYSYTPVLIQSFAVYIIQNVSQELTGTQARDLVESEYVPAIFCSILRRKFPTQFTNTQYRATFTGHGPFAYRESDTGKGKAVYTHEVTFEQLAQLCREDMVGPDDNVAMRDIDYTLSTDLGSGTLTADIDLDDEPL